MNFWPEKDIRIEKSERGEWDVIVIVKYSVQV